MHRCWHDIRLVNIYSCVIYHIEEKYEKCFYCLNFFTLSTGVGVNYGWMHVLSICTCGLWTPLFIIYQVFNVIYNFKMHILTGRQIQLSMPMSAM